MSNNDAYREYLHQSRRDLEAENARLRNERDALRQQLADLMSHGAPAAVEVVCMDARQYEANSVKAALSAGLARYGSAMKKLAE